MTRARHARRSGMLLLLALAGASASAQEAEDARVYRLDSLGLTFTAPARAWTRSEGARGGRRHVLFEDTRQAGTRVSVQVWSPDPSGRSPSECCASELV